MTATKTLMPVRALLAACLIMFGLAMPAYAQVTAFMQSVAKAAREWSLAVQALDEQEIGGVDGHARQPGGKRRQPTLQRHAKSHFRRPP